MQYRGKDCSWSISDWYSKYCLKVINANFNKLFHPPADVNGSEVILVEANGSIDFCGGALLGGAPNGSWTGFFCTMFPPNGSLVIELLFCCSAIVNGSGVCWKGGVGETVFPAGFWAAGPPQGSAAAVLGHEPGPAALLLPHGSETHTKYNKCRVLC